MNTAKDLCLKTIASEALQKGEFQFVLDDEAVVNNSPGNFFIQSKT